MLDHGGRRQLLYNAVTLLEPYASAALIQHYVSRRHGLILPMLRIYVDLERLTRAGHLVRHISPRLDGCGTAFFWETPGLVLVEPVRVPPKWLAAGTPVPIPVPPSPDVEGLELAGTDKAVALRRFLSGALTSALRAVRDRSGSRRAPR